MSQSYPSPPTELGTVTRLPREIQRMIYALVFPSSLSLFLTFHRATTARESSTYFTISNDHSTSAYLSIRHPYIPAPHFLAKIQNIDICIDMPEPYTHYKRDLWTHHTWGPGGFITDVIERIVAPMESKKSCRLTFVLGSVLELHPFYEPRVLDCLALLRTFGTAVLEFRKSPWIGDYPRSFGRRVDAENDADPNRLHNLAAYLGYGEQMQEVDGPRNKLKIVRTTSPHWNEQVLWDSSL